MMRLLPAKATFAPDERVELELRGGHGPVTVALWHLRHRVAEVELGDGETVATFPPQAAGGYGATAGDAAAGLDVLADPLSRPRYGFVVDFAAGREVAAVLETARALHLNVIQFYDWMFRHAELLPPTGDGFDDALGRHVSLGTVERLAQGLRSVGALPVAYAAVYAVGRDEWPLWEGSGLYHMDGEPWTLGDFLWIVDPSDEAWLAHLVAQLRSAGERICFAGFHLDQYGSPKYAFRRDGTRIDLAEALPALVDRVARDVEGAELIFNNVNDFPSWTTVRARQRATYIEVWPPHRELGHLADLATAARLRDPTRPVILAAYLASFAADDEGGSAAEELVLATAFSHGATVLLHGDDSSVLTDAYYVRCRRQSAASFETTRRYYDFAVRYGDLLFDVDAVDVTRTHLGGENREVDVDAAVPVSTDPRAGALWVRAVRGRHGLWLSIVDLSAQTDVEWNAPKSRHRALDGVTLRFEAPAGTAAYFTSPVGAPSLLELPSCREGRRLAVGLPSFRAWAIVWICEEEA